MGERLKKEALGALRDAVYDLDTDHRTWLSTMAGLYRPFFQSASRIALLDVKIHEHGASRHGRGTSRPSGPCEPNAEPSLTSAEQEVTRLAAFGESDRSIANTRRTSVRTVANLLRSAYKKLQVANRTELVRALRQPMKHVRSRSVNRVTTEAPKGMCS